MSALEKLSALFGQDMQAVEGVLAARLTSSVTLIPEVAGYLTTAGGKRLRPLLVLATARLAGCSDTRPHKIAACVECLHTATLLHDDVVDNSQKRRDRDTANEIFGNKVSVLVGDFLLSQAFQLMVEDGSLEILGTLSRASRLIAEGEVLQMTQSCNMLISRQVSLQIIEAKTAELFAAATLSGGLMADCNDEQKRALESYGRNLGIAFQLADDVLDYTPSPHSGKEIGRDFSEGKVTFPVILAFEQGDKTEQDFWKNVFEQQQHTHENLPTALTILKRRNALEKTLQKAEIYSQKAKAALALFPPSDLQNLLLDLADFSVRRDH